MTSAALIKEHILIRKHTFNFRGTVHYHHDGEHGGLEADIVLKLRVLYLSGNRKSSKTLGGILSIGNLKACTYCDILPPTFPQSHIS